MIYIFIIICICVQVFVHDPLSLGVTTDSLCHCLFYQFAHASWLHLAINAFCLAYMFKPICNLYNLRFGYTRNFFTFIACYLVSVFMGLLAAQSSPTVGASGMVFFLLGMLIALNPTKKQFYSMVWVALSIAVGAIFGNSAILLHILCMIGGALYVVVRLLYVRRRLHKD